MLLTISMVTARLRAALGFDAQHDTVLRWVTTGRLPGVKAFGRWLVSESDLDAFVASIRSGS